MSALLPIPTSAAVTSSAEPTHLMTPPLEAAPLMTGSLITTTAVYLKATRYTLRSCPNLQVPYNLCPYDNSWFEKCVCDPNLVECTKPYYGVGEDCNGKYTSCQLDNQHACEENGYTQSGACPPLQEINQKCPYDPTYYDKCVCRSDLVTCSYPLVGVGEECDGKYASCPTKNTVY